MRSFLFLFALLFSLGSFGQTFITPFEANDIYQVKSILVTSNDDTQTEGAKFTIYTLNNGMLGNFTIKTPDGEKKKFKVVDVKMVQLEPNGFAKAMMFSENISMTKVLKNDYSFLEHMKYIYYEKIEIKAGKFKLLQLLNPGFDEYIKVYLDPNAKETSHIGFGGGEDKSYYIQKGDQSFLLKKKNYKKEFANLFGDCKPMMGMLETEQIDMKFKDFPLHIAIYNESQ